MPAQGTQKLDRPADPISHQVRSLGHRAGQTAPQGQHRPLPRASTTPVNSTCEGVSLSWYSNQPLPSNPLGLRPSHISISHEALGPSPLLWGSGLLHGLVRRRLRPGLPGTPPLSALSFSSCLDLESLHPGGLRENFYGSFPSPQSLS